MHHYMSIASSLFTFSWQGILPFRCKPLLVSTSQLQTIEQPMNTRHPLLKCVWKGTPQSLEFSSERAKVGVCRILAYTQHMSMVPFCSFSQQILPLHTFNTEMSTLSTSKKDYWRVSHLHSPRPNTLANSLSPQQAPEKVPIFQFCKLTPNLFYPHQKHWTHAHSSLECFHLLHLLVLFQYQAHT